MIAATLGHYVVEGEIGSGGMGVVYLARDEVLGRRVAIKVLRPGSLCDPKRRRRFRQEAQAASALNDPNIVTIHEIGTADGADFIVMEWIDGTSLRAAIPPKGFGVDEALRHGIQIASAMASAHRAGILHRDLKPANVLLTWDGTIKVVDFGLAKSIVGDGEAEALTNSGEFLGTPGYAAPELWQGARADARADVFALGSILFEMLTGRRATEIVADPRSSLFRRIPAPIARRIPGDLRRVVSRAMQVRPEDRYPSAVDLLHELEAVRSRQGAKRVPLLRALARPWVWTSVTLLLLLLIAAGILEWKRARDEAWLETEALPRAVAFVQSGETLEALRILRQAEMRVRGDPRVQELLDRASKPCSITTSPPGADLFIRGFFDPPDQWEPIGRSPTTVRLPAWRVQRENQGLILKAALDGYTEREVQIVSEIPSGFVELRPAEQTPMGMILVPGGLERFNEWSATLESFWIDRTEVTNREYLEFVREGAYDTESLWDGTPQDVRPTFVDRTGRRGPASWEGGAPPVGKDDHPVSGVSWYEAQAFCRSQGKDLPTLFHWYSAARFEATNQWTHLSNFNSAGTEPVGRPLRRSVWGSFDMAGNVREWVLNEALRGERWALGGSYVEPSYSFRGPWAEPPASRELQLGFRCAKYETPPSAKTLAPIEMPFRDYRMVEPLSNARYEEIDHLYDIAAAPLDARVHRVEDRPDYRLEEVSFAAGYQDERVRGFLFLPRSAEPPFQTVIYYPGGGPFFMPADFDPTGQTLWFLFLIHSGRAVFFPEYKGSFGRYVGNPLEPGVWRDVVIGSARDFSRTVDYLRTRDDLDPKRIAFYGISMGGTAGVILTAREPRIRASVLLAGGVFFWGGPEEVEPFHFAPRVRVPTLMINGKHDYYCPYETSQKPLYERLGTPHKRHVIYESGHLPSERAETIRETLDWFDRWLGSVQRRAVPGPEREAA